MTVLVWAHMTMRKRRTVHEMLYLNNNNDDTHPTIKQLTHLRRTHDNRGEGNTRNPYPAAKLQTHHKYRRLPLPDRSPKVSTVLYHSPFHSTIPTTRRRRRGGIQTTMHSSLPRHPSGRPLL